MHDAPPHHADRDYKPAMGRDALLPLYDTISRLLGAASLHRELVEQAQLEPGHRVLDVGCGTGNLTVLAKRLRPGAQLVGLDPDPRALARARRKAERRHVEVRFDHGFAERLPYPDAAFDRVLSSLMFHHLDDRARRAMLDEARRVLRPGGTLLLLDVDAATSPHDGFLARRLHRGPDLRDSTGDRIPTLMSDAGFAGPTATAHRATRIGRLTYYRAQAPSGSNAPPPRVT